MEYRIFSVDELQIKQIIKPQFDGDVTRISEKDNLLSTNTLVDSLQRDQYERH